jgi:OmcA/MtrC family decaheme c-type cytochrome
MATSSKLSRCFLSAAVVCLIAGCGKDGKQGPPGALSVDATTDSPATMTATITGARISSAPVIDFSVQDGDGLGVTGLRSGSTGNVRFTIAKLVPGTNGNTSRWQSYVHRASTSGSNTVTQATYDRDGALVDHGNGSYTYTFSRDIAAATDPVSGAAIPYEPRLTHRIGMQISNGVPAVNATYDFVPGGGSVSTRDIAMTSSCNECHGRLTVHGSRYELKYCVTCHNPGTADPESGASGDMTVMTHRIHAASMLSEAYVFGEDYSEVTYPQDLKNCRKCHDAADAATSDGDSWKNRPTALACGSCHDDVSFMEPVPAGKVLHSGGVAPDNTMCASCHTPVNIGIYHRTENVTPNNPDLPAGLSKMEYEILGVTANESRQPVVTFRIKRDGAALDLLHLPTDLTGSPGFLLPYALAQDGIDEPADYNNLGRSAGQPTSVSIANLIAGTAGSLEAASDGAFTATITTAYPEGAALRAVALQGYFSQTVAVVGGGTESVGRHTYSVIEAVSGDAERREVVDNDKCLACHEIIEGHGGNRVSNVAVCVTCHNPNLSSSGRTVETPNETIIGQLGADPLAYPEDSNNMKDLIHGLHASGIRTTDYEFVRNRNGGAYYNWSEVTFPGVLSDCLTCHKEGTYEVPVASGALATTVKTTTGNPSETRTEISGARDSIPNDTDLVTTPIAAACTSCHDTPDSKTHAEQNGGFISKARSAVAAGNIETCAVCHRSGRSNDVTEAHGLR